MSERVLQALLALVDERAQQFRRALSSSAVHPSEVARPPRRD
jgi:hypothetical protein